MRLDIVHIDNIIVPEGRTREDFGNIDDLAYSIAQEGIISPLAVMDNDDGTYTLLGGERRHKACIKAEIVDIPIRIYDNNLDEYDMKLIELSENIYRKDFTWQEEVDLKTAVHELHILKFGVKETTRKGEPEEVGWSLTDTANFLNESKGLLSMDINLSKQLKQIPELKECKNKNEARKLVNAIQATMVEEEIAHRITQRNIKGSGNDAKRKLMDNYIVHDFFLGVKDVPDNSVHIVEIDPPYAINLKDIKKHEGVINEASYYNEVPEGDYIPFMMNTIQEAYRVLSHDGWLILWFGQHPWFPIMYEILTKIGFKTRMITGIWKKGSGQTMQPSMYLANDYEMFFYARKDGGTISKQGRGNIFDFPPVASAKKSHMTERPIELIEEIFKTFGWTGCRVMVPFLGSGNSLLAAHNLGMDCFGYELSPEYKNKYIIRVNDEKQPFKSYKREEE